MDKLQISSFYSDNSSEGSDLQSRQAQAVQGPDHYRTATPPSSPHDPVLDTPQEKPHQKGHANTEVQRIVAFLTTVLDRLCDIKSKFLASQPVNPEIALSSRDLTLLHFLLHCDPPFSSRYRLSSPELAAVEKLRTTHRKQIKSLGPWFSRCRSDFYDNRLILRMLTPIHADVTNDFTTYLHHRFLVKLREAGRSDYIMMLRQGTKSLAFKKRRRRHEPDSNLWLDFTRGFQGNDSEEEAEAAQRQATQTAPAAPPETQQPGTQPETQPETQQPEAGEVANVPRAVLPKTTRWPAVVVEVGWSHPTADDVCVNYLKNGHGHIRCVIRLDMEYVEPKDEHKVEAPTKAILDGWRLHEEGPGHEPVHFIQAVNVFTAAPDIKVAITLNDLHSTLPASKEVPLNLHKIASYVHDAFRRLKRRRDNSESESTSEADESDGEDRHRVKRARV